jgi:glutamyl-tRNA reductase
VIDRELLKRVMKARRGAPMFLVDIAVPRDVDPEVTRLEGVFLYNIDDLQGIVHDNLRSRSVEAERAGVLVGEEVAEFVKWQRSRGVGPLLKALQGHGRAVVDGELARLRGKLQGLTPEQLRAVETLANGVVQKLLHRPMTALRQSAAGDTQPEIRDLAGAVQALFGLAADDDAGAEPEAKPEVVPAKLGT